MNVSFSSSLFELADVSYQTPDTGIPLLNSVTLSISPACVTGIIGRNGSGKSSLMKVLARQQPAGSGCVLFQGRDLQSWKPRELARRLAYLPQHPGGASDMLVKELVALGRYPWNGLFGRFGARDQEIVNDAIDITELQRLSDRLEASLSGGERQRAWLAMLIAQQPQCLLLDEPTSALDLKYQLEVLSLVQRKSRQDGLGTIVVLHDVNMAARFCDEIVALRSGSVVAHGSPEEVITTRTLYDIYQVAMDVHTHTINRRPFAVLR